MNHVNVMIELHIRIGWPYFVACLKQVSLGCNYGLEIGYLINVIFVAFCTFRPAVAGVVSGLP